MKLTIAALSGGILKSCANFDKLCPLYLPFFYTGLILLKCISDINEGVIDAGNPQDPIIADPEDPQLVLSRKCGHLHRYRQSTIEQFLGILVLS